MGLGAVLRILPVNVETVETEVGDEINCCAGKGLAPVRRRGRLREVGGICPAANGEEGLEVPVPLLEEEELLDAAVHVCANVVPAVGWVVLFEVGIGIGKIDFPAVRAYVGE